MASKNKQLMVKTSNRQEIFTYARGNVNMKFTWNIDIKSELKDALACFKEAIDDVEKILAKH